MYLMAAISLLMAIWISVSGQLKIVLIVSVLVVTAHILATYLGGKLRANAQRVRRWREETGTLDPDEYASRVPCPDNQKSSLPPPSTLGQRSGRLRWLPVLVTLGAFAGGVLGWMGLAATIGHRASGSASTALLGAWTTFVAIGFVSITRHAWREAQRFESQSRR